jgi:hypothetical protein
MPLQAQQITFEDPEVVAQAYVPEGPVTAITFEETTFDFGAVEEGELVRHVYTFTNIGNEFLVLSDAKGSCGCTVPKWPREPIAPGETASITVEFNSTNKKGKRNQKVTITANTNPPQTFIYLTGEVAPREDYDAPFPAIELDEATDFAPDCLVVYPNPTAERLILDMKDNIGETVIISIYAQSGQMMAQREIEQIEGTIEFQVGHYPPGNYIANVQLAGKQAQSRCFVVME